MMTAFQFILKQCMHFVAKVKANVAICFCLQRDAQISLVSAQSRSIKHCPWTAIYLGVQSF
jgi:predicted enzyme involved in methoxymalonyl-ACP biosynthesis